LAFPFAVAAVGFVHTENVGCCCCFSCSVLYLFLFWEIGNGMVSFFLVAVVLVKYFDKEILNAMENDKFSKRRGTIAI
jgi:hypothetical protein